MIIKDIMVLHERFNIWDMNRFLELCPGLVWIAFAVHNARGLLGTGVPGTYIEIAQHFTFTQMNSIWLIIWLIWFSFTVTKAKSWRGLLNESVLAQRKCGNVNRRGGYLWMALCVWTRFHTWVKYSLKYNVIDQPYSFDLKIKPLLHWKVKPWLCFLYYLDLFNIKQINTAESLSSHRLTLWCGPNQRHGYKFEVSKLLSSVTLNL